MKKKGTMGIVLTILAVIAGLLLWLGSSRMMPEQERVEQAIPDAQIPR